MNTEAILLGIVAESTTSPERYWDASRARNHCSPSIEKLGTSIYISLGNHEFARLELLFARAALR